MIKKIESAQNQEIKRLKALRTHKGREKEGKFFAEGVRLVETAFRAGAKFHSVFACPDMLKDDRAIGLWEQLTSAVENCFELPFRLFKEIADTDTPQGILAVFSQPALDLNQLYRRKEIIFLLMDAIQDPGNLGTIIRTADAAGIDGIFYTAGTVDPFSPKAVRATMGSLFHLPLIKLQDPLKEIERWKRLGIHCYAAALEGAEDFYSKTIQPKAAFFIGNEANGLSKDLVAAAHSIVKIPLIGKAESLNVAIAAGILMFETLRQKRQNTNQVI